MQNAKRSRLRRRLFQKSYVTMIVGISALAIAAVMIYFQSPTTLNDVLNQYGYQEIVPPSKFHGPGTFNSVEQLSDQSVKLYPTCNMDPSVLSKLWEESPTVNHELMAQLSRGVAISSDLLKSLSISLSVSQAKDAHLSLQNMKILLLNEQSLSSIN